MGAGIAAVAGIDNEPSSQHADIEEAQAELRQELAGWNERRRELDFLEKGGDPLEFKFGEALPGLWSLSPADSLVKHHLPSDGRGSLSDKSHTKEDNTVYNLEDSSESKRVRGTSGKFCIQDHTATSISGEKTPPEALPTNTSSSLEHDRKDPPKKELDACKSNKVAVKGQYARRNRQQSNRFSNGSTSSRDLGKAGAEGGSSIALTGKDHAACDAEVKDVAREISAQLIITDQPLQSGSEDVEACVRDEQDNASAAPETTAALQASSPHDIAERGKELQTCEPLVPESTLEAEDIATAEQDGPHSTDKLPSVDAEEGRDMPSTVLLMGEEEKNLLHSVPCDSQAKNFTSMEESTSVLFPLGANENRVALDDFTKSCLDAQIMTDKKKDATEVVHVAGSDKPISAASKIDLTLLADHQSTMHVAASECIQRPDMETSAAVIDSVDSVLQSASDSSISGKKVEASNEKLSEKEININELCDKAQKLEEVKVKVEHEILDAGPVNAADSQGVPLQLQYPVDDCMNTVCDVVKGSQLQASLSEANGVPPNTLPVVVVPKEKLNLSEVTNEAKPTLTPADKETSAQKAEGIKDHLKDSADWAKESTFQKPPRKKSHWDFVLEEMAWLANDFMQERLWKIAAAAHVARWVVKEKGFEEMEIHNKQCKIAQSLARSIKKFWSSIEARLLKEAVGVDAASVDKACEGEAGEAMKAFPVQAYALRFLKDSSRRTLIPQAEAPLTPDRVSECGSLNFWDGQFSEVSLFYTVPINAMEVYRQLVVSQWEGEYEQRLQEHESELDTHVGGEVMEYSSGTYAVGPRVSPLVTGKRSSGVLGPNPINKGSIPTKRIRTSAVAARQRAAGGTGPLVSIPLAHLARSDISSCETNSQQDEMTALLEGSSVSGRATDVDSNGAFARNNLAVDGVDSPFKSKKKKKTRHFNGGHTASVGLDRESEKTWQNNSHRQSEQKEHSKQKAEHAGISGLEGLGVHSGAYHGASVTSSASKLIKQITGRDRSRKYKGGKASSSQPGIGIPWSPVEDQAILGLVYELGANWELVSDILSSNSQLKGIFRKPKDCKERYKMLTDRHGGEGGDSPDDPSSVHHSILMIQKGGTRFLPQHLEETLKSHLECILQLHQQLRSTKLQSESQELKQLVPEHESHAIKPTAMTPVELCELSSTSGELVSHTYPIQPAHGNGLGIPNMLSSGVGIRPASSAMPTLQGANNAQMSPSMSPSATINASVTRDAQRMGLSMRPLATAEEQRLRYSRMVGGRGLQMPGLSVTSAGSPLMNLPNAADCTASQSLSSGNSAGMMCGLSRGMPVARMGLPGLPSVGVPNISAGMNNASPSVGIGLSGGGAVNAGAVSSPVSMLQRPREAISMGHSPSAAQNNVNTSLPSSVGSSPTQSFSAQQQQQLLQRKMSQSQQQSPSSTQQQQQAYNMMHVAKERQQMQQQQQKRMQQQSPTSNPFQSSQPLSTSQQQHGLSPHGHVFPQQHQPSHLLMQQHTLQEPGTQAQHAIPPAISQSAVSPSGQPSLSSNSRDSQQLQSSQTHQPTSTASSTQTPFQTKHHNLSIKQQQQQLQGKNMKTMGREGQPPNLPSQVSSQMAGQQMPQAPFMGDSQGPLPQYVVGGPFVQNIPADVGVQQFQQKGFPHLTVKHMSQVTPPSIHPTSPPTGPSALSQQQQSPGPLPVTQQQRRPGPQSQSQQRRHQQAQTGMGLGAQGASQSCKTGLQPSSLPSQLPVSFQLGSNTSNPLTMASSSSSAVSLSSPNNSGSGGFSSPQWKPGQNFTPMAAGLYNLSRTNSGIAAQAPHLAMSVGMHLPLSNGKIPVAGVHGSSHVTGHVGALSQKVTAGSAVNSRSVPVSQHPPPSQRQLAQQQQLSCTSGSTGGQQLRPASSGNAQAPE